MKKLLIACFVASIALMGCKKDTKDVETPSTPAPTTSNNTFTIATRGTFTAPSGSGDYGGVVAQDQTRLSFAFISKVNNDGSNRGGGGIIFPLGAPTGSYTVVPEPDGNTIPTAGTCYVNLVCNPPDMGIENIAQSGTVSLTVTGSTYKIVFTELPSLTDESAPGADKLSGNFSF
jgi:hypothetical protein